MNKKTLLVLEDGTSFEGFSFGAEGSVTGEVVFSTNMTGFQESLTDQNYAGQILVQTFPLVGNPGVNSEDSLSDFGPAGFVVREFCEQPSNFRCEETIESFMKKRGIIGLYGIDTRRLTRHLREHGTMNGRIAGDIKAPAQPATKLDFPDNPPIEYKVKDPKYNLALLDFGYNNRIVQLANEQFCNITVLPWNADVSGYDGVLLSNGAGNPNDMPEQIARVKELLKSGIKVFGLGLGHQLLALAHGLEVVKMKNAHRGANIPVKNLKTGEVFITKQNHGYAVNTDNLTPEIGKVSCINVNDNTCEGIIYKDEVSFSFQFIPESIKGFWLD